MCSNIWYHAAQPPWESLIQGAVKEALTNCQTSDSGGAMQILSWLWRGGRVLQEYGVLRPLLRAIQSLYNRSEISVPNVFSGCWALPGLSLVTDSVCDFHGQDLKIWRNIMRYKRPNFLRRVAGLTLRDRVRSSDI